MNPTTTVATSKVSPPVPGRQCIARPALVARLVSCMEASAVVLVSAASGFGKTTLAVQAVKALTARDPGTAVAWLTLDCADDLHRFVSGLALALEPHDLPWRVSPAALAALGPTPAGLEAILGEIVHALANAACPQGVIVLDDVHAVNQREVMDLLGGLVARTPTPWNLLLLSRVRPPLKLGRALVQGRLAELGHDELLFGEDEVMDLLRTSLPDATAGGDGTALQQMAQRLMTQTEGWAAGLHLLLKGSDPFRPGAGRRSSRHLLEYMTTEVLAPLPAPMVDLLVRCSILEELTASRCERLTGDPAAGAWLREIERIDLFVTVLDEPEYTLRLDDVFRSILEEKLRIECSEQLPNLLRRAAVDEPDLVRRVSYWLRAGDIGQAERELDRVAHAEGGDVGLGDGGAWSGLSRLFPADVRERSPVLAQLRALRFWEGLECHAMLPHLALAVQGFRERGDDGKTACALAYQALALHMTGAPGALALRADLDTVGAPHQDLEVVALKTLFDYCQALAEGPDDAPAQHLNRLVDILSTGTGSASLWYRCAAPLVYFADRPGHRDALERFIEGALAFGETHLHLHALARLLRAGSMVLAGDLRAAQGWMVEAEDAFAWLAQPPVSRRLPVLRALHQVLSRDDDASSASCRRWMDRAEASALPRHVQLGNSVEMAGRLASAAGDWGGVRRALSLLSKRPMPQEGPTTRLAPSALEGRLRLHEGRHREALPLLVHALSLIEGRDRLGHEGFVRVCLAVAHARDGDTRQAWETLAPMLERLASMRAWGALWVVGRPLLQELARVRWEDVADADAGLLRTLRCALEQGDALCMPGPPGTAASADDDMYGGDDGQDDTGPASVLSLRERQVLELVALGDSNKLIARKLQLSPNTVKRHVARILGRLDLHSRRDAARWFSLPPRGTGSTCVPDTGRARATVTRR